MSSKLKYFIIPYIALGLTLSVLFGVKYDCTGSEMFPTYYGNPFVFIEKSLGSSLTYYYSVSGLLLNLTIHCLLLMFLRYFILKLIKKLNNNIIAKAIYNSIIGFLLVFSTLVIFVFYMEIGRGFNYWYIDMDREADTWGMECEGDWFYNFKE